MDALKYTFIVRYAYVSLPLLRVLLSQTFLFSLCRPFGFIMCKATTMHSGRIIAHLGPGKADSKKMLGKVPVYIFITRTRFSVAMHVVYLFICPVEQLFAKSLCLRTSLSTLRISDFGAQKAAPGCIFLFYSAKGCIAVFPISSVRSRKQQSIFSIIDCTGIWKRTGGAYTNVRNVDHFSFF